MFNGIIFNSGKVKTIKKNKKSILIGIESDLLLKKKDIGSSICCDGVCLTLVKVIKLFNIRNDYYCWFTIIYYIFIIFF